MIWLDDEHSGTSQVSDQGGPRGNLVRLFPLATGSQTLDELTEKTQVLDWTRPVEFQTRGLDQRPAAESEHIMES